MIASESSSEGQIDDATRNIPEPIREGVSTTGSEPNWPVNTWWVAAHGSEVSRTPTMRWIVQIPVVLYRQADGLPVAMHNRCPHRAAPLSLGEVDGDNLTCPYHGMQFAPSGLCSKVPTQEGPPPSIRVRTFPVQDRFGFIWIWMGDPELADPALIPPELEYLSDPKWQTLWGYKAVSGNYMQMKENVLDLTHFAFLHKNSLGVTDWNKPPSVEISGDQVTYRQKFEMAPLAAVYAVPAGKPVGKPMDRESWGTQLTAAVNHAGIDMHDAEPEPGGLERFSMRVVHLTTPVAIGKTHYYWAMARDHGPAYDYAKSRAMADVVFGEDIAIVEATQAMSQRAADQDEAMEFSVLADRAAIEGRRKVAAKVRAERKAREALQLKPVRAMAPINGE